MPVNHCRQSPVLGVYICKGVENGCQTRETLDGSNPYHYKDHKCTAARHSGMITSKGGFYRVKNYGKISNFVGSTKNGITTKSLFTSYDSIYISKF